MNKNIFKLIIFLIMIICAILLYLYFNLVDSFDVKVYDENKPTYNIGDLFNMLSYVTPEWPVVNNDENLVSIRDHSNSIQKYLDSYPNSILYNYYTSRPKDEPIPNVERIITSTDEFIKNNHDNLNEYMNIVSNNNTLTVHIRSGDKGVIEDEYVEIIKKLSNHYERIFVLSGIHKDKLYLDHIGSSVDESKNKLKESFDKLNLQNAIYNFDEPDIHLSLMRTSSNLLTHKGGFSLIGGLLFQKNNLYISPFFDARDAPTYKIHLKGNVIYL